jgi:hypothetical protein
MRASIAVLTLTTFFACPALAQDVNCDNFQHGEDKNSWTAKEPMIIEGPSGQMTLNPRTRFQAGVKFMGIDLGAMLDQKCR